MPSITGLTAAEVESAPRGGADEPAARVPDQNHRARSCGTTSAPTSTLCFWCWPSCWRSCIPGLNMGFLGIVFWNTLIGIVQQLRAKRTIDKLTLVSAQKLRCLRDGQWCEVLSDDLVQDDVVEFGAGDQIAADAVVLDGSAQANESLITGEARAIPKECGAELKSGSFLMAGRCVARLTRVGAESYASRLTARGAGRRSQGRARRDDAGAAWTG